MRAHLIKMQLLQTALLAVAHSVKNQVVDREDRYQHALYQMHANHLEAREVHPPELSEIARTACELFETIQVMIDVAIENKSTIPSLVS